MSQNAIADFPKGVNRSGKIIIIFWAVFILNLVKLFVVDEKGEGIGFLYRSLNYIHYIPILWLYWLALKNIRQNSTRWFAKADLFAIYLFLAITIISPFNAALFAEKFEYAEAVRQVIPYLGILLCFLPSSYPSAIKDLGKAVQRQTPLIVPLIAYVLVVAPMTSILRIRTEMFGGLHYMVLDFTYSISFLLPFLLFVQLPYNIIYWIAFFASIVFAIFIQSRASVMVLLIVNALLLLWFLISTKPKNIIRKIWMTSISLLFILILTLPVIPSNRIAEFGNMAWEGLMFRMTKQENTTSFNIGDLLDFYDNQLNVRVDEVPSVLSQATFKTWLIGNGFGSFWFSDFWQTWFSFVHNGHTNMLMKGGILYPISFMFIVLRALIGNIKKINNPYIFACYVIVLDRVILFSIHAGFYPGYSSSLFWICLGYLLISLKESLNEQVQNFNMNK